MTIADGAGGPRRPEGRYGPPRRPVDPRTVVAAGTAVALLAVTWFGYVAFGPSRARVHTLDVGYRVVSDSGVRVTFEVQKARAATAVCTVRALNAGFAEVGLLDVRVGPSPGDAVTVTAEVPTTERAVSGNVKACTVQ